MNNTSEHLTLLRAINKAWQSGGGFALVQRLEELEKYLADLDLAEERRSAARTGEYDRLGAYYRDKKKAEQVYKLGCQAFAEASKRLSEASPSTPQFINGPFFPTKS